MPQLSPAGASRPTPAYLPPTQSAAMMAKILLTPVVGDIRNKAGATIFSANKSGKYIKLTSTPFQPKSSGQMTIRGYLAKLARAWAWTLTAGERADWYAWVGTHPVIDVFGQTVYLNALTGFIWVNQNLHAIGVDMLTDAPPTWTVGDPTGCTVTCPGPPYVLEVTSTAAPAVHDRPLVWASPPMFPGRIYVGKLYRIVKKPGAGVAGPWDITSTWQAKFGPIQSGFKIFAQVSFTDDLCGRKSLLRSGYVLVA